MNLLSVWEQQCRLTSSLSAAAPPFPTLGSTPQVVLGWYGCQDKHLSKYSSLLEKQGYPSLRGILPGHAVFSPFAFPRRRWAASLLDAVAAVDPEGQRPVVLYAFSNGEAWG